MHSPAATTELRVEHISAESEPDLSKTAMVRHLRDELNVSKAEAANILREKRDARTRKLVGDLLAEDFRAWVAVRKAKLSACDQRIGGPNWRTSA